MNSSSLRRLGRVLTFSVIGLVVLIAGLLAARQVLFRGPFRSPTGLAAGDIVDLHCHTAGIGAGGSGCLVSSAMRANPRFRVYLHAFGVTEEDLRSQGDALMIRRLEQKVGQSQHIRKAVILALDGVIDTHGQLDTNHTDVYVPNEFVARETARTTNLLFGASVNPSRPDALERLDWCARHGAVLVKWIPSTMLIDPADPRHVPFYRKLKELGLPLLSHTGSERSFTFARDELADPERLRLALEQGVVVIAAHAGGGGKNGGETDLKRVRRLMREFPNLYSDVSALTQFNRIGALRDTLAAPECQGRLVYGSDFPLINTPLVSAWYYPLNLTNQQREAIERLENPWDRDVLLKQTLGVPADTFARSSTLLRIKPSPTQRP